VHDPPRILIVDDNATNRDILATRLATQGLRPCEAADARRRSPPPRHISGLILLDVMMPKLNGFEVCRRLKSDASLPFTPIILVTPWPTPKTSWSDSKPGADEYLTKPVDQAALVARVRSVLRLKALHDQVVAQAADLANWNRTLEHRVASKSPKSSGSGA